MVDYWNRIADHHLAAFKFFKVRQERSISPRTKCLHDFLILQMNDWVNVVPVTDSGKVVMLRQYRHGTRTIGLEIPGGVIECGEKPMDAATRELMEETGYKAEKITPMGRIAPNPALQNNWCHTFLANGTHLVGDQKLDPGEDIDIVEVEPTEIKKRIAQGQINHSMVIVALAYAGYLG